MAQLFSTRLLIIKERGISTAIGIDLYHACLALNNYRAIEIFVEGVNNQIILDIAGGIKPLERTGPAPIEYLERFNRGTPLVAPTKPYCLEVPVGYPGSIIFKITEAREIQS